MNKYNNPRLLNTVVSGTGMKHPVLPHVVVGDVSNGFIRGDLMDANAIVDLVNSGDAIDQETIRQAVADVIGTAPENLDTLGEVAETLTDMQDPIVEGSLANQISVINTTIEDNELTIAAALNDLNSRILELVTRVDALDGGGDTPSTKTLWSLRGGDGIYFGQFQDGKVIFEGPSEDKIYVADLQGKIKGFENFTPEYEQVVKEMFAQYFGEIESVQVLATGHEINYVVPNWAEYKLLNL